MTPRSVEADGGGTDDGFPGTGSRELARTSNLRRWRAIPTPFSLPPLVIAEVLAFMPRVGLYVLNIESNQR